MIIGAGINALGADAPADAAASTNSSGPKIAFETPVYDFGKAKSGDPVKHTYLFTNTGDAVLYITNVQPSCGCTTAGDWSKQVEPGKTGTIPVQFNSANYNGGVFKTITVTSNAKDQQSTVLQLKGTVWKPIEISPQFAMITVPPDTTPNTTTIVRIVNNMDDPIDVWEPEANNKSFVVELKTNKVNKEYELAISAVGGLEASASAQISVKSSGSNAPGNLTLTAMANVQPALSISPPQITLPAGPLPDKQTSTVTIQNNSAKPLSLSEPAVDNKDVEVQLAETQPSKQFTVTLTFPKGFELAQGARAELSVKTSHPRMPLAKVVVTQMPRPMTPVPVAVPIAPPVPAATPAAPPKTAAQ
jgi:hypothetical protein